MSKQILASTKINQGENTTMKIRNLILVLSALALPLQAADVGSAQLSLPIPVTVGETKLIGVFLTRPVIMKGEVNAAVTLNATSFTAFNDTATPLFGSSYAVADESGSAEFAPASGNHYIIEFTSGAYTGLIKQVTGLSGNVATVRGGLPALSAGTKFILRLDQTLASLFGEGTTLSPLKIFEGGDPGDADVVGVLSQGGVWKRYFYQTGFGWRDVNNRGVAGADRKHVRVATGTGFSFKPIEGNVLHMTGEYRGARSRISLSGNTTLIANPYPKAVSLKDSGLAEYLTSYTSPTGADSLRFLEGNKFVSYFYHSGGNFKKATGLAVADTKSIGVGEAFLILPQGPKDLAFAPQYITK
jgi:hypothetical protein